MPKLPCIQKVSAAIAFSRLFRETPGSFILRWKTKNDKIVSSSKFDVDQSEKSIDGNYVVLSVRVDENKHRTHVMHYYLPSTGVFDEADRISMIDRYDSNRTSLKYYTPLKNEIIIDNENDCWTLNPNIIKNLSFSRGKFDGKNNAGVSRGFCCVGQTEGLKVFVKKFVKNSRSSTHEFEILRELNFFSVINLIGHYSTDSHTYLVFPDSGRSLISLAPIRSSNKQRQTYRIVRIAFQIVNAMVYLEKSDIVHRDLTASNILVDDHGFIRIADFGHAIRKVPGANNLDRTVTEDGEKRFQFRFLAPECFIRSSNSSSNNIRQSQAIYVSFTSKSDVWAFGIVLIQLLLKDPSKPYPEIKTDEEVRDYIALKRKKHERPKSCDLDLYYIMELCWAFKPCDRISFTELREKFYKLMSIFRS